MTITRTRVTHDQHDQHDQHVVRYRLRWPIIGVLMAIAATTAVDAFGASAYVANSMLLPLFLLFWYLQHLSRAEIGLTWGRVLSHGRARTGWSDRLAEWRCRPCGH